MSQNANQAGRRGMEQFGMVASAPGLDYCVSGAQPYSLDFAHTSDVICLVLGEIVSQTQYDDGPANPLTFHAETAAFHPRNSRMRIEAKTVRHGFIAFSYSDEFQRGISDKNVAAPICAGSRENIGGDGIKHLVRYARGRALSTGGVNHWEMHCLATLTYLEATRHLNGTGGQRKLKMSDAEFERLNEYLSENLERSVTCADIAGALGLPVRVVFDGVKARTGYSLYRLVLERRIDLAQQLLRDTDLSICDVAVSCGFSSQQHMTALFSERLGVTPLRVRKEHVSPRSTAKLTSSLTCSAP
jgi:AraC family transcriptional regulator